MHDPIAAGEQDAGKKALGSCRLLPATHGFRRRQRR
jgi:hypothetical protein